MPSYRVAVARLAVRGEQRVEIGTWLREVENVILTHPLLHHETIDIPIQRVGTDVARNLVVKTARWARADFLVMVDEDMGPPVGWFKTALDFLIGHATPAVFGSPYVCAPPMEDVQTFEWASCEQGTAQTPWGLTHVTREDATRRKGVQRVDNIGTGLVAYSMSAFDAFEKAHGTKVFYAYGYNDEHTAHTETEDAYCHRRMAIAGVPLYCSWDLWSGHYKVKRCERPALVRQEDVDESYLARARAELLAEGWTPPEKTAGAAPEVIASRRAAAYRMHTPANGANNYLAGALVVAARPDLGPRPNEFPPDVAASWAASVPGWMHHEELQWLACRAAMMKPGDTWVELGVWKGRSLAAVFLAAPEGTYVFGIDHGHGSAEHGGDPAAVARALHETMSEAGRLRTGESPGLQVLAAESVEAAATFADGSLAAVFVDAGHDHDSVAADLEAWEPKLRPGGLLAGHDRNESGVRGAVNEFARKQGLAVHEGPGSIWYCRLPVAVPAARQGEEQCPSTS